MRRARLVLLAVVALALLVAVPTALSGGTAWVSEVYRYAMSGGNGRSALNARAGALGELALPWDGKSTGQVREFQITIARTNWELEPGKSLEAFTYNGSIPGPTLRVTEGDTVRVTVTNALDEPTTVHWHGLDLPLSMDGVAGMSQDPIQPGTSFTYEFIATPAGTRWYHSHFRELLQHGGGLYGALIVEPLEAPAEPPADREYTLFSGEMVTGVRPAPQGAEYQAMGHGGAADIIPGRPLFDRFAINGKTYAGSTPLLVRQGERVRLRVINASTTESQVLALAGHRLRITHSDGNPLSAAVETEAVRLGAGERADLEFVADNPGRWRFQSLSPGHFTRGLAIDVLYEGREADPAQGFDPYASPNVATYAQFGGPPHPDEPQRVYDLTLSGDYDNGESWTINGKRAPFTDPLDLSQGDRVRLKLYNASGEDHPMHLHGHSFQLVAIEGQPVNGPIKDTLTVGPEQRYEIEFVGNNPATWLFHCHNIVHMGAGMSAEVRYGGG